MVIHPTSRFPTDRRGATLALVSISIMALMSFVALAVDLGLVYSARAEAQRAADAAALAGAQEFMTADPDIATPLARDSAIAYAGHNDIRGAAVLESEVDVEVLTDIRRVRVTITRPVETLFAKIFGVNTMTVRAEAAAEASEAGSADCIKPFAIPDMWDDQNQDLNGNRIPDPPDDPSTKPKKDDDSGENWTFDPGIDIYDPHTGDMGDCLGEYDGTGYGSCFRNDYRDFGEQIKIKVTDPNDTDQVASGFFMPVRLERDTGTPDCTSGGGTTSGGKLYENNICSCNTNSFSIGDTLDIEPGNMVGPTHRGIQDLVLQDENTTWEQVQASPSSFRSSPRVLKIALFDPANVQASSDKQVVIRNFALMFVEEQENKDDPITARFLYYADGNEVAGENSGSLAKILRLVE